MVPLAWQTHVVHSGRSILRLGSVYAQCRGNLRQEGYRLVPIAGVSVLSQPAQLTSEHEKRERLDEDLGWFGWQA